MHNHTHTHTHTHTRNGPTEAEGIARMYRCLVELVKIRVFPCTRPPAGVCVCVCVREREREREREVSKRCACACLGLFGEDGLCVVYTFASFGILIQDTKASKKERATAAQVLIPLSSATCPMLHKF
jgi:hypothetical protein